MWVRFLVPGVLFAFFLLSAGLLGAETAEELATAPLEVVLLPFAANEGSVLRLGPLRDSLPQAIIRSLWLTRVRQLNTEERSVLSESILLQYPQWEGEVPVELPLEYRREELESETLLFLYHSQLRRYLEDGSPFSPALTRELALRTEADLALAGSISVRDQYVFLELLLLDFRNLPAMGSAQADPDPLSDEAIPATGSGPRELGRWLYSLRSIEAQTELEAYSARDLGAALYQGPSGTLELESTSPDLEIRAYLNGGYVGTLPLSLAPVAAGSNIVELYRGSRRIHREELEVRAGEPARLEFTPEQEIPQLMLLSTVPGNVELYRDSLRLGVTPLLISRPEGTEYLQLMGEGLRTVYLELDDQVEDSLTVCMHGDVPDWDEQLQRDRRQLYGSFGFTLVSAMLPLFLNGWNENLSQTGSAGLPPQERQLLVDRIYALRSLTVSSLWVTILSFAHTMEQLFEYLDSAEQARGVYRPGLNDE